MKKTQIVALHGFTGCGMDFLPLAALTSDVFDWHTPDFMGHGFNKFQVDKKLYSIDCQVDFLHLLFSLPVREREILTPRMRENDELVLLGYSMGARIALSYAIKYPDRVSKLILIGVNPGLQSEEERLSRQKSDEQLAEMILKDGVKSFLESWQKNPIIVSQKNIPKEIHEAMWQRRLQNSPTGLANSLVETGLGMMPNLWGSLPLIKCPVILFTGEQDEKFKLIAQKMTKLVPFATHIDISGAGHAAHLENINLFVTHLKKLL